MFVLTADLEITGNRGRAESAAECPEFVAINCFI